MHNAFAKPPLVHFNMGILLIYFNYNGKVYVYVIAWGNQFSFDLIKEILEYFMWTFCFFV